MAANDTESKISILYVEDERETREALSEIIHRLYPDIRLLLCQNGASGIASFKLHRPEVVITDINMPLTNGIQMAAEIKKISPGTEIIVVTAYSNTPYLLEAIEIGISHYLLKPVDINNISRVIDKALVIIRAQREIERQNLVIRDLNAELTKKTAALETLNSDLQSFNYSIAHDLRLPIATINVSQMLLDMSEEELSDASKRYLQVIRREISRMDQMIGTLLKFSVQSQRPVMKSWTSLTDIALQIKETLLNQEPERQVTFSIAEGISGFCNSELMQIVLQNLFINAWKYTSKKDDARIEFGAIDKDEDLVYFVRDNGVGFDQQDSEKLFIPFQRLQIDDEVQGIGIGLATAAKIIERHGGRISAEGVKGEGAVFYFTL